MVETLHIYTRVSTSSQEEEGTSLDTQKELGIECAKKLKFKHRVWNEGGQSSARDDLVNRPVLTELLNKIDEGEVQHLYVWNTDRLSRNVATWGMIRLKLITNDVTLHTPTGKQLLSDPATNMLIGIMGEVAQYDNQLRTERFRLGKLKRIREGGWMGGPPPYGYSLEDSKLLPNEDEVRWVKFIFENYSKGMSVDDIRTELLNNGVVTRRGKPIWSHGSIDALLQNTHYGGYYNYTDKKSGEKIRVSCPSILDATLIKSANESRESRRYGKSGTKRVKTSGQKYTYLLTDLLMCTECGCRFGGHRKTKQTSYYECLQKVGKFKTKGTDRFINCGSNRNLRIDVTDQVVWNSVIDVLSKSHLFKETVKQETPGNRSVQKSTSDLKKLQRKIDGIDSEITKVTDSIVNLNTERLIGNLHQQDIEKVIRNLEKHRLNLETDRESLASQMQQENENRVWIDWLKEFGKRIDDLRDPSLSVEEKKRFLEGVVDQIDVSSVDTQTHELQIKFAFPYVGDKLVRDTGKGKTARSTVKGGRKVKKVRTNLLKKSVKSRGTSAFIQ